MNELQATSPNQLLQIAIDKGVDMPQLEKLMDLQERWENKEAKKAFSVAMAEFQGNLPSIAKTKTGHNCKYADIDDIATAVRPVLEGVGLSYRFEQAQVDNLITVTCIITHISGHQEQTTLQAPSDGSGGKNDIQAIASAVTYLRRYTLTGALGITTGLDDDDGGKPKVSVDRLLTLMALVREEFFSIAAIKQGLAESDFASAKEAFNEISHDSMRELWVAPSKGGMFTTQERAQMQSKEWGEV